LDSDRPNASHGGEEVPARSVAERVEALREEHCWIISVDVCCHCGDSECDGVGCIAALDPNDERDHKVIEDLHASLREAQAWRIMHVLFAEGEVVAALMLAQEALAVANNQTIGGTCERCGQSFPAQTPCDDTCTTCRLVSVEEATDD